MYQYDIFFHRIKFWSKKWIIMSKRMSKEKVAFFKTFLSCCFKRRQISSFIASNWMLHSHKHFLPPLSTKDNRPKMQKHLKEITHTFTHTYTLTQTNTQTHKHTLKHTHTQTHTHTNKHTQTHTHTHTPVSYTHLTLPTTPYV